MIIELQYYEIKNMLNSALQQSVDSFRPYIVYWKQFSILLTFLQSNVICTKCTNILKVRICKNSVKIMFNLNYKSSRSKNFTKFYQWIFLIHIRYVKLFSNFQISPSFQFYSKTFSQPKLTFQPYFIFTKYKRLLYYSIVCEVPYFCLGNTECPTKQKPRASSKKRTKNSSL